MKTRLPCRLFMIACICISMHPGAQSCIVYLYVSLLCASKNHREHARDRVNKNTHLVPFRMPGILCLLGSDYFPSPHAGCAGEQINYAAQHNVSPIQRATGRV